MSKRGVQQRAHRFLECRADWRLRPEGSVERDEMILGRQPEPPERHPDPAGCRRQPPAPCACGPEVDFAGSGAMTAPAAGRSRRDWGSSPPGAIRPADSRCAAACRDPAVPGRRAGREPRRSCPPPRRSAPASRDGLPSSGHWHRTEDQAAGSVFRRARAGARPKALLCSPARHRPAAAFRATDAAPR